MRSFIERDGQRVEIELGREADNLASMQQQLREAGALQNMKHDLAAHVVETRKFIWVQLPDIIFEDEK